MATKCNKVKEMLDPSTFLKDVEKAGIKFLTGVPDSLLASFCETVNSEMSADQHVIVANEGAAVGTAAGYHMATGEVPMVYMQNSGLGNAVSPVMSLADNGCYGIPMVMMIGWRGAPGSKDEP